MKNIHATCVKLQDKGVLLIGRSGAGKSDLALRLIQDKGASLVADDRVNLTREGALISASAPAVLAGLLEVRGVGLCRLPFEPHAKIDLVVELVKKTEVERLPMPAFWCFEDVSIPLLRLYPFESSATDKIVIKLNAPLI